MEYAPYFFIFANDEDITDHIRKYTSSLSIIDKAGMESDTVSITLSDPYDELVPPPTGAELNVRLGYGTTARHMGRYVVDTVSIKGPPDVLTISAKGTPFTDSKAMSALHSKKRKSWFPDTLGVMAITIANEHGLILAIDQDLSKITLPHVDQVDESNINLLTRMCLQLDATVKANDGKLIITRKANGKSVSGATLPILRFVPENITSYSVKRLQRSVPGKVVASWYNCHSAKEEDLVVGDAEPTEKIRHIYPTKQAAAKAAQALYNQKNRNAYSLDLSLPGNPNIIAEGRISLEGFRTGVNGLWDITEVSHKIGPGGYTTSVKGNTTHYF